MSSIVGDEFANFLFGTSGDDSIDALGSTDFIFGLDGNDTIDGGTDNDTISSGNGRDIISGGTGNDAINGGSGDDTLVDFDQVTFGLGERDTLVGGSGRDLFVLATENGTVAYDDGNDSSFGTTDFVIIEGFTRSVDTVQLVGSVSDYRLTVTASLNTLLTFNNGGNDELVAAFTSSNGLSLGLNLNSSDFAFFEIGSTEALVSNIAPIVTDVNFLV